jgi:hypothetical protein
MPASEEILEEAAILASEPMEASILPFEAMVALDERHRLR